MKQLTAVCLAAMAVLSGALCADAPTLELDGITKGSDLADLKTICHMAGYATQEFKDADGDPSLMLQMGEYKVQLILYGKDDHFAGLSCQCGIDFENGVNLDALNDWNSSHRFSRAYKPKARPGTAVLCSDLDLSGGLTWMSLANFLKTFESSFGKFHKALTG